METILITGGSGKIGRALIGSLNQSEYDLRVLSRSTNPISGCAVFKWDVNNDYIDASALDNVDHIIHLAGADVSAKRWKHTLFVP